jgi:hypothetical protein
MLCLCTLMILLRDLKFQDNPKPPLLMESEIIFEPLWGLKALVINGE